MEKPTIVLGVELMDRDHLRLEEMLEAAAKASDEDLPKLHREIVAELAAHFAREEALMRDRRIPGLHCHVSQHNMLVADLRREDPPGASAELRRRLQVVIPQLILSHVATMDRMAAAFLNGEIGQSDFDQLRLPLPGPTE